MSENLRIERGWPVGPSLVAGGFLGLTVAGAGLVGATPAGWVIAAAAFLGVVLFMVSCGQWVNHLKVDPEPNYAQGALGGLFAVLLGATTVLREVTEALITAPLFGVLAAAVMTYGLHRWVGWVVRDDTRVPA